MAHVLKRFFMCVDVNLESAGDKFEEWWNAKYFHHTLLYRVFKKLAGHRANFVYIDFLCGTLRRLDELAAVPIPTRKIKSPRVTDLVQFGAMTSYLTSNYLKERYWRDESHFPELSMQEHDKIIRQAFKNLAQIEKDKHLLRTSSLLPHFFDAAKRDPILFLLSEFAHRPKRGNQKDQLGSLFLVAVTEHLNETAGQYHYATAADLLDKVRYPGGRHRSRKSRATSAKIRVDEFKQTRPDWNQKIEFLNEQFLKFQQHSPA